MNKLREPLVSTQPSPKTNTLRFPSRKKRRSISFGSNTAPNATGRLGLQNLAKNPRDISRNRGEWDRKSSTLFKLEHGSESYRKRTPEGSLWWRVGSDHSLIMKSFSYPPISRLRKCMGIQSQITPSSLGLSRSSVPYLDHPLPFFNLSSTTW